MGRFTSIPWKNFIASALGSLPRAKSPKKRRFQKSKKGPWLVCRSFRRMSSSPRDSEIRSKCLASTAMVGLLRKTSVPIGPHSSPLLPRSSPKQMQHLVGAIAFGQTEMAVRQPEHLRLLKPTPRVSCAHASYPACPSRKILRHSPLITLTQLPM